MKKIKNLIKYLFNKEIIVTWVFQKKIIMSSKINQFKQVLIKIYKKNSKKFKLMMNKLKLIMNKLKLMMNKLKSKINGDNNIKLH